MRWKFEVFQPSNSLRDVIRFLHPFFQRSQGSARYDGKGVSVSFCYGVKFYAGCSEAGIPRNCRVLSPWWSWSDMKQAASWLMCETLHMAAKGLAYPTGSTKKPNVKASRIVFLYLLITVRFSFLLSKFTHYLLLLLACSSSELTSEKRVFYTFGRRSVHRKISACTRQEQYTDICL